MTLLHRGSNSRATAPSPDGAAPWRLPQVLALVLVLAPAMATAARGEELTPAMQEKLNQVIAQETARVARYGYDGAVEAEVQVVDLNHDGAADMIVGFTTASHCSMGGCVHTVYIGEGRDSWTRVSGFVGRNVEIEDRSGSAIAGISYESLTSLNGPVRTIRGWNGSGYTVTGHEDGDRRLPPSTGTYMALASPGAFAAPDTGSEKLTELPWYDYVTPLAALPDRTWYLVQLSQTTVAYVRAADLIAIGVDGLEDSES